MPQLRHLHLHLLVLAAVLLPLLPAGATGPYAGQETHAIKALSPQEVDDLLAGRGRGLAKTAELNSYPGPLHVLELAVPLGITAAQRAAVEASRARMSAEAKRLGAELVAEEQALDAAFARGRITPEELARRTARIGDLQGRLRAAHLSAHLETRAALDPGQVALYDALRGYGGGVHPPAEGRHGEHGTRHPP